MDYNIHLQIPCSGLMFRVINTVSLCKCESNSNRELSIVHSWVHDPNVLDLQLTWGLVTRRRDTKGDAKALGDVLAVVMVGW